MVVVVYDVGVVVDTIAIVVIVAVVVAVVVVIVLALPSLLDIRLVMLACVLLHFC